MIYIVRTKGKAGYLVWKLAGGQGDQDINLPWGSFEITFFFNFLDVKLSVANPLLIVKIKLILTRTYQKGVYIILFNLSYFLLERRGCQSYQVRVTSPELIWRSFLNQYYKKHKQNTNTKNFKKIRKTPISRGL